MDFDYAIHSDFLIHWTGKDIDNTYDPTWYDSWTAEGEKKAAAAYISRVSDILEFGLWMTEEPGFALRFDEDVVCVPQTSRICFTELRLSLSMRHAKQYGRLGIGVKRPFLFDRRGRPLVYFGRNAQRHNDDFLRDCAHDLRDKRLLHFFKSMNSSPTLNYDFYAESEWRVIHQDDLVSRKLVVDPRDSSNPCEFAYYQSLSEHAQNKLKYLIPLDGWFTVIIYPGLEVKNAVRQDDRICQLIRNIKSKDDNANRIEGGNWPVELCLADTRNF
ncbi:MAG TPA: hypothetical protein VMB34_13020 [Acetobacteraceae bacterium]|nr:hypothetical protein [Acetobacteraceae bacterium]